jgi:hypothetical protein
MIACFTGCAAADPLTPPIQLPFAVHQKGATVSTILQMLEERDYPFSLRFYYNEKDKADRGRVRKVVGGGGRDRYGKIVEPGIQIPLKITINILDSSGERPFLEKEVLTAGIISWNGSFRRKIDNVKLAPGLYRVTVQSLKDVPELVNTKVTLGIYLRERGKS